MNWRILLCIAILFISVVFIFKGYSVYSFKENISRNGWNDSTLAQYNSIRSKNFIAFFHERINQGDLGPQLLKGKSVIIKGENFAWNEFSSDDQGVPLQIPLVNPLVDTPSDANILIDLEFTHDLAGKYGGEGAYESCLWLRIYNISNERIMYSNEACNSPPERSRSTAYGKKPDAVRWLNDLAHPS